MGVKRKTKRVTAKGINMGFLLMQQNLVSYCMKTKKQQQKQRVLKELKHGSEICFVGSKGVRIKRYGQRF